MKRKALIIGCPGPDNNYLKGVSVDVKNYIKYSLSYPGGAWEEEEITRLMNPGKAQVLQVLNQIKATAPDYTIVTFSGHGWESTSQGTMLELNNGEEISVKELNTGADRQLRILDSCRAIEEEQELLTEQREIMKAQRLDGFDRRKLYRKKYESEILRAEKGITILFACSENETAGENHKGGYFTQSITNIGATSSRTIDVKSILAPSKAYIDKNFEDAFQNPTKNSERRMKYYPWCIVL